MEVVVFGSDVLIGFLNADDAHHEDAVRLVREAIVPGTRRWLCAVNYAEILIGPTRAGKADLVDQMLVHLNIETKQVDMALARAAAAVRSTTGLKLPDAFALATAMRADRLEWEGVRLASFDRKVIKAYKSLRAP